MVAAARRGYFQPNLRKTLMPGSNAGTCKKIALIAGATILITCGLFKGSFYAAEKNAIFYNTQGWEQLARGDTYRAVVSFRNALNRNPRYREALLGLGKCCLAAEAFDESMKLFNDVLRVDGGNIDAVVGMGFAMTGLGRYNDALKYFDDAVNKSEDNLDAKYGMAKIYHLMGRRIWAKRKIEAILRVNPYHYDSLLLMADIKSDEGRLDDAKKFIEKAIESNRELPEGYIRSGIILYRFYLKKNDFDYCEDAIEEFNRALSIQPENFAANRYMGFIALSRKKYDDARAYFQKSLAAFPGNGVALYNLGLACDMAGDNESALRYYVKAVEAMPSDEIAQSKLEDFLVFNNYKTGHPLRVSYGARHYEKALKRKKENLIDETILNLKRSLYLNPLKREPRELLSDYYRTMDYYRFYIDEMKDLMSMNPEEGYQDQLNIAIIKRRDRLYYRAGFEDAPRRDVPVVLVLDLWNDGENIAHPDVGVVLGNYLTFALGQFGRQAPIGIKERRELTSQIRSGDYYLGDTLETLQNMARDEKIKKLDYIIYGACREKGGLLSAQYKIMNLQKGIVIDEFELEEAGKDAVSRLSLRAAWRIYGAIPYEARILKIDDDKIYVNIGLFDGVKPGDFVVTYKYDDRPGAERTNLKRKLVFTVDEADTLVSSAKPMVENDLNSIDVNDAIYPLKKRRAKMIK